MENFFAILPFMVCLFWTAQLALEWRKSNAAKRWLTIFMGVCTLLYLCHAVFFLRVECVREVAACLYIFCNLAVFPLYLVYIYRLTIGRRHIGRLLVAFIPAVMGLAWAIATQFKPLTSPAAIELSDNILRGVFLLQMLPVCAYAYLYLRDFDYKVEQLYSNTEHRSARSTQRLIVLLVVCFVLSTIAGFIGRHNFLDHMSLLFVPSIIFACMLFAVGYIGNKQNFSIDELEQENAGIEALGQPAQAEIEPAMESLLMARVNEVMEREKLYLQPDLLLTDLAAHIGVGRTTLSASFNREKGVSFSDYVNNLRIEYAKQIMSDRQKSASMSIIQIAEQSGFASESSFYRVFRKNCGMTPKQWLETRQNTPSQTI